MPEATNRTITIQLGGRAFTVRQLPIRADAEWRAKAKPMVEPVIEIAMQNGVPMPTPDRLAKLAVVNAMLFEPMAMLDVIVAYAPEQLGAEQQWIEENAYPDEIMSAVFTLFLATGTSKPTLQSLGAQPQPSKTI